MHLLNPFQDLFSPPPSFVFGFSTMETYKYTILLVNPCSVNLGCELILMKTASDTSRDNTVV